MWSIHENANIEWTYEVEFHEYEYTNLSHYSDQGILFETPFPVDLIHFHPVFKKLQEKMPKGKVVPMWLLVWLGSITHRGLTKKVEILHMVFVNTFYLIKFVSPSF